MISVVTPWRTLLSALGLIGSVKSEWVLMSMKPGATASPAASMVLAARPGEARADRGDAAVRDGEIARHAGRAGAVVKGPAADQDVVHGIARMPSGERAFIPFRHAVAPAATVTRMPAKVYRAAKRRRHYPISMVSTWPHPSQRNVRSSGMAANLGKVRTSFIRSTPTGNVGAAPRIWLWRDALDMPQMWCVGPPATIPVNPLREDRECAPPPARLRMAGTRHGWRTVRCRRSTQ